ncbi:MAG: hypothetical protein U0790_12840 [Isosphaeraceae bacterium]
MIVVADSSPIVVLASIGQIEVLPRLFGQVLIPPEVAAEPAAPGRTEPVRAFIATPPGWLEIRQSSVATTPIPGLHAGETAAIALARQHSADLLLIDERLGRQAAAERQLRVAGTIGILEMAAERGLVELGQAFNEVRKTDFWVIPRFLDERLALFREREREREQAGK